jgi:hypothetical protein
VAVVYQDDSIVDVVICLHYLKLRLFVQLRVGEIARRLDIIITVGKDRSRAHTGVLFFCDVCSLFRRPPIARPALFESGFEVLH